MSHSSTVRRVLAKASYIVDRRWAATTTTFSRIPLGFPHKELPRKIHACSIHPSTPNDGGFRFHCIHTVRQFSTGGTSDAVLDETAHALKRLVESKSPQAPQEADFLLQKLDEEQIEPNFDCLFWALECWCQTKRKTAEERIEHLYQSMWQCFQRNRVNNVSSSILQEQAQQIQASLLRVLEAYHHASNAHRAEDLLLQFADRCRSSNQQLVPPPTMEDCKSVLKTWSRSSSSRRATRAEKLLSLMSKDPILPDPDITCYTMVLNCWASSEKENAPRRAELLLRSMEFLDNKTLRPNLMSYTCVLNAWARCKEPKAPDEAERLLREIQDEKKWKIDRVVYTAMISVWGRSTRRNAIDKAEEYFQKLCDLERAAVVAESSTKDNSTNVTSYQPTVVEYTALIQAWAYHVARHVEDSRRAVDRVDELLDELLERYFSSNFQGDPNAELSRPNRLTFASIFRTISAARRIPNRHDRAMAALQKMEKLNLEPNAHILGLVEKCSRSPRTAEDKKKQTKNRMY